MTKEQTFHPAGVELHVNFPATDISPRWGGVTCELSCYRHFTPELS
jgi:hypothetical protein